MLLVKGYFSKFASAVPCWANVHEREVWIQTGSLSFKPQEYAQRKAHEGHTGERILPVRFTMLVLWYQAPTSFLLILQVVCSPSPIMDYKPSSLYQLSSSGSSNLQSWNLISNLGWVSRSISSQAYLQIAETHLWIFLHIRLCADSLRAEATS